MSDNFQDNVSFRSSTLGVAGDAIAVGTAAGVKSIIFNNSDSAGHLVWQPNANATLSIPAAGGTVAVVDGIPGGFAAGTQTATSGTVVLSNSNGVSFGMSNSSIVTASFSQTNQTIGYFATGNTTQNSSTTLDARSITFNGLGGLSAGYSNGSVQFSAPGTSSLSATGAISISVNANTISIGAPATSSISATGGASVFVNGGTISIGAAFNVSAGTTSNNLASITFSNSNGVSFGLNGSTITGSISQTNQTLGKYAIGNTVGESTSSTFDARSISFSGAGIASVGYSGNAVVINVPAGGASIQVSAGTTSNGINNLVFSNSNGVSFGLNGSTITANILIRPEVFEPFPLYNPASTTYLPANGTIYIQPFVVDYDVVSGRLNVIHSFGNSSAAIFPVSSITSIGSNTTGSRSISFSYVKSAIIYSRGTGTNNTRIESMWSNTWSIGMEQSVSVSTFGATSVAFTNAATVSYIGTVGTDGAYTTSSASASYSTSSASSNMATSLGSAGFSSLFNLLSGPLIIPIGFNTALTPGNYWFAQAFRTSSTTAGTNAQIWSQIHQSAIGCGPAASVRIFGNTTSAASSMFRPGHGAYSASTASPPTNIAFTEIRSAAVQAYQYFNIMTNNT